MKIDEILSELRWRERSVENSMETLKDLYSRTETFGYGEERLDGMIEEAEKLTHRLKELKEFRGMDLVKEETGA